MLNMVFEVFLHEVARLGPRVSRKDNPGMHGIVLAHSKDNKKIFVHWGIIPMTKISVPVQCWHNKKDLEFLGDKYES